jgi:hypothetical protein
MLYATADSSFSFDGERGSWIGRFGFALTVRMAIAAIGQPQPIASNLGCRGDFLQVAVSLRGRLLLRTRTRFFGTLRRGGGTGIVIFNRGGPVDCSPPPRTGCPRQTSLAIFRQITPTLFGQAYLDANGDTGARLTSLAFSEAFTNAPNWSHLMSYRGFNGTLSAPIGGPPPTARVQMPKRSPIQGGGTFAAGQLSIDSEADCLTGTGQGGFAGSFRTRFTGWGRRTLRLSPSDPATWASSYPISNAPPPAGG